MNTPLTKEQVKALPKGLNVTRKLLNFNKETLTFNYYPNRKERRSIMFNTNRLRIKNKPQSKSRQVWLQKVPIFINEKGNIITRLMKAGKDFLTITFVGFKNIFHRKIFKNWISYQPIV